jgi:hypothetical protein
MYGYLDRHVTSLTRGEYFLISSMRSWVKAMADRQCPPSVLGGAFARRNMDAALPHFHMAMVILNREGLRKFSFAPLNCGQISDDEALILQIFGVLNAKATEQAEGTLTLIVAKEAVRTMFLALCSVAVLLREAGLTVELPRSMPQEGTNKP